MDHKLDLCVWRTTYQTGIETFARPFPSSTSRWNPRCYAWQSMENAYKSQYSDRRKRQTSLYVSCPTSLQVCSLMNKFTVLSMNGKRLAIILQSPAIATFRVMDAIRLPSDPRPPPGETDDPNPGVLVLCVDILPGHHTVAVIFVPMWDNEKELDAPPLVQLSSWNLTSHSPL